MKLKITIALVLIVSLIKAQTNPATPNAGLESWTQSSGYSDPNGWNDLNSLTTFLGIYTCIQDSTPADVHSGKYAARLITLHSSIEGEIPGTITTGTINATSQTISGGIAYTLTPDSIIGWYKYTSVSGDNADIEFYLFGTSQTDTVGEAFFKTPTSSVTSYTRISYPISYRSSHAVTTALWIITSSIDKAGAQTGSQLYIDDLGLIFDSATGIANISNPTAIKVGPNPTSNYLSVNNTSDLNGLTLELIDITGRKISESTVNKGNNNIEVTSLPNGIYMYAIYNQQNTTIKTGKIVIQK